MTTLLQETAITCPSCWERIEVLLDLSISTQDYIEDCSVCCRPIRIHVEADGVEVISISAVRTDD